MKKYTLPLTTLFMAILLAGTSEAGRIRLRKVKDAPKVCSQMNEDQFLSRQNKKIYGTLRNSLIIEDDISVVNDLGKKVCHWQTGQLGNSTDLSQYKFYIDEYRDVLYPYKKNAQGGYKVLKISLGRCEVEESQNVDSLDFPKCEKGSAGKKKSRRSHRKSTV